MLQRTFDVFLAVTAVVILSPFLLSISLVLKITGEGEVIYRQKRIGKNGSSFEVWKFATMLKDSPIIGTGTITIKDDPRVLPFGKFLRATKINELPQLFNILNGSMSIVGPRPLTEENWDLYSEQQKLIISSVVPGLTGVGSIYFRDEENILTDLANAKVAYAEKITPIKAKCEIWYVQNKNIFLYFAIILVTAFAVIFKSSTLPVNLVKKYVKI